MLATCVIIGKVVDKPKIIAGEKGYRNASMLVETDCHFMDAHGLTKKELFNVSLWRGIADECAAACHKGSLVAIRGRLEANNTTTADTTAYNCEVVAEKVSILS